MKEKLSIDVHSKIWWTSIISLGLVLAQQVAHLFGWEITSDMTNQIMAIVNSALAIGGLIGIIWDTSNTATPESGGDKNETQK